MLYVVLCLEVGPSETSPSAPAGILLLSLFGTCRCSHIIEESWVFKKYMYIIMSPLGDMFSQQTFQSSVFCNSCPSFLRCFQSPRCRSYAADDSVVAGHHVSSWHHYEPLWFYIMGPILKITKLYPVRSSLLGPEIKAGSGKKRASRHRSLSPKTQPFYVHLPLPGWRHFDNKSDSCLPGINRACWVFL